MLIPCDCTERGAKPGQHYAGCPNVAETGLPVKLFGLPILVGDEAEPHGKPVWKELKDVQ